MTILASDIKEICFSYGADLTGIASVDRFIQAPAGFGPTDVLPDCRSVIVIACRIPTEALHQDSVTYTDIRNGMVRKMNEMATTITRSLRKAGMSSKAVTSINGKWINGRFHSPISLKHAGELAGLGKIGKNYLLTTPQYGNMIWLSAILVTAELAADPLSGFSFCNQCNLCVEECPAQALGKEIFGQKECYKYCYKTVKGKLDLRCWNCRKVCPYTLGIKSKK